MRNVLYCNVSSSLTIQLIKEIDMELGDKVKTRFWWFFVFGLFSFMLAMGLGMFDGPYRAGRLGVNFWPLHGAAALALVYSGMFGLITCEATEISSTRYNLGVAWVAFAVIASLYFVGIYFASVQLMSVKIPANWGDYTMATVASATAIVAAYAFVEACKYFLRIHRLRAPYRRQLHETKDLLGEE